MFKFALDNRKSYVGLEIEGGYVKLAQAEDSPGERKITRLIIREAASSSEGDIVRALIRIKDEFKGKIEHLTVCIPRYKVTVRFLHFPTVNEKEVEGMVRLQSVRELPFPKEEIISDYLIGEITKDGYAKVVLVIVHQDVVNNYLEILKKANLQPQRITFSTEAILDWFQFSYKRQDLSGCAILIDLDADNIDLAIFNNSYLEFTRGIALETRQLSEPGDLKNRIADEVRRTIEGYTRQRDALKVEKLFLGQSASVIKDLTSFLEREFNLPCEVLPPLKSLPYQKGVGDTQYKPGLSLIRVLGAVMKIKRKRANLLPVLLAEQQAQAVRKRRLVTTFIFTLGIILLSLLGVVKKMHDKQLYRIYLEREIKKGAPLAKEVENMLKQIELLKRRGKIEGSSVDILRELHRLISSGITLSSFFYDEESEMAALQGISTNMPEIFTLVNNLEKSSYFKNVQLKYVSERRATQAGFTEFKIECTLER